jgi:hypothetical protein
MMPNTYVENDSMKRALRVAKPMLSCRKLEKPLFRARFHVVEQAEHDSASRFRVDHHIETAFLFDT